MKIIASQLASVSIKLALTLILLLSISLANASTTYTYTSSRLTSATGGEAGTYSYNSNGSMTGLTQGGTAYTLTYDWMHNTTSYNAGATTLAAFTYDGDGTRVTKTGNGTTTVYHTDKEGSTITETDVSGNLIANYIYVNGKLAAKKEPTGLFFYHTDPAGTPLAMTNSAGAIAWKADYKPFGEELITAATKDNYKMFVGKEKDKETGLYYFGARYLQDKTARFVSVDPVGPVDSGSGRTKESMLQNPQLLNRYIYSLNNPYRFYDPDGRETIAIITRDTLLGIKYGSHAAVRVDNPKGGGPVLYDPAGTVYSPKDEYGGPLRGSNDTFYGDAADANKYKTAQENNGSTVELYRFNTTPEQEQQIAERIDRLGGKGAGNCTVGVCQAIQGIGPFKDVGTYRMPGSLADKLQEIKKEHPNE